MVTQRYLLAIALVLAAAQVVTAQPAIVNIQLQPGSPRTIEVTPNVTAVCRHTPSCPTELNFRWVGTAGSDATERIQVEYKDGLFWGPNDQPSQIPATACFSFPGGQNPFQLEFGAANGRNLVFQQDAEECPDKVSFFFEISCQNEAGDNCGGVVTLDPGTMVDNGGRP